jgi:hypothetical protein
MPTQPEEPEWLGYALREYEYHQTGMAQLDEQRLQIRNWSITVSGALLAVAFSAKVALIAYGSVLVALLFFFLEAIFLSIEQGVIDRSNFIETLINDYRTTGAEPTAYEFGVSHAHQRDFSFKDMGRLIFGRRRLHLTAFHVGLVAVTILGAVTAGLTIPATGAAVGGTTGPPNVRLFS